MIGSFQGLHLKLDRAEQELHRLEIEVRAYLRRKPYKVEMHIDEERGWYEYALVIREQPPPAWGVAISEIVHGLRSALDHAVYELTKSNTGHALDGTGFPIFLDEARFRKSRASGVHQMRGIRPGASALIERAQPYATGNSKHPLWMLHCMDAPLYVEHGQAPDTPSHGLPESNLGPASCGIVRGHIAGFGVNFGAFQNRTTLGGGTVNPAMHSIMDVYSQATYDVAFGDPQTRPALIPGEPFEGEPLVQTLKGISAFVNKRLISRLERFL